MLILSDYPFGFEENRSSTAWETVIFSSRTKCSKVAIACFLTVDEKSHRIIDPQSSF